MNPRATLLRCQAGGPAVIWEQDHDRTPRFPCSLYARDLISDLRSRHATDDISSVVTPGALQNSAKESLKLPGELIFYPSASADH